MPRCNCGSRCNCVLEAGDGVTVSGAGTSAQPYVIGASGGGAPVFFAYAGVQSGSPNVPVQDSCHAHRSDPGFFLPTPMTLPPVASPAGGIVAQFTQQVLTEAAGSWMLSWSFWVTNMTGTQARSGYVEIASPGVGGVPTPPAVDWSTSAEAGTDLTLVDSGGQGVVKTTAGGVFVVSYIWGVQAI